MKKLTFVLVLLLTVAIAMPAQANFPDVSADHWAYEAVVELQAAGIVEGYPDGEFKGQQNMTRYEMALIIARMLDDLNMQLEAMEYDIDALYAEVDELSEGLTAAQADDVAAIVQAMLEEHTPEREEGLTAEQSEQVVNLIRALTAEFNTELRMIRDELGAMEAWGADIEANQELIADLEERMAAREVITFRGNYSVNFEHKQIVDEDGDAMEGADFGVSDLDAFYIDGLDDLEDFFFYGGEIEVDGNPVTSEDEFVEEVRDFLNAEYPNIDDADDVDLTVVNNAITVTTSPVAGTYTFEVVRDTENDMTLPIQDDTVAAFDPESGFTQSLTLGMDIKTDLFTAGIDLDIVGAEDEISLDSAALDVENDFLHALYSSNNAVSLNDFAVSSETLRRGVSVEFKEWGIDSFFGEYDVAQDAEGLNEITFDEDDRFERSTETPTAADDYLMGLATDFSLGNFTIGTGMAMQAPKFDLLGDDANAVFTAMTGYDVGNIELGLEGAVSYPFDDAEDLGFAVRGNAFTETNFADLTLNLRFQDGFNALHGNANVFGTAGDKYEERFAGDGEVGVFAKVDQKIIDLFTEGYVEFGLFEEDIMVEAGGSMPLVFDLVGSASVNYEDAGDPVTTINAGLAYDVAPLEFDLDYTGIMDDAEPEMENTLDATAAFAATDNLSLSAGFKTEMNKDHVAGDTLNTLTAGAAFTDFELINNLTLGVTADYKMVMDLQEKNTIELGLGLDYVIGNAVFSNQLDFVNMTGADVARDGNRITNNLTLDYEIVDGTDLTGSFKHDRMMFDDPANDDWSSNEIKAGISLDF